MTAEANEQHIASLRTKTHEERARIAELNGKLGDLKQWLRQASSQLDMVNHYFLDAKTLSEDRTPQRLTRWLRGADAAFKIAVETREYVESLVAKYGPNARMISG